MNNRNECITTVIADDSGMFYGLKFFNDILKEAGPDGNIQSEMLLEKDISSFTFKQGWAFPRSIYFNGDECKMPLPEDYPYLPNYANSNNMASLILSAVLLAFHFAITWPH